MFSHFTLDQANKILPSIIEKFDRVVSMKDQVIKIQSDLESNPKYMTNFKDYIIKKQELNSAITGFYKSIEDLEATGVSIKSIDQGLMDFPSLMFNEEIWLCWKRGETEIKFWHGKEEGFNGRKPIESIDLEKLR
ncbi:DUF2203 domain-containing protein [Candidatus Nitrosotalea okcheonensis]|uniref:DUF2203 domain-containing protein n=1 Tax=Candidatus Nitrosotalea okcheonensis TaxID=1903276 RepID=A0A2H1FE34_9ARCH|nr:DUF2203 domain-containing protein [Candidatus Nitrosotalea okcheonensis]SMH71024.1 conserved protein of unknown function [Candidatus Nitrosotalea okcheonensis]